MKRRAMLKSLKKVMQRLPVPVMATDKHGVIMYANRKLAQQISRNPIRQLLTELFPELADKFTEDQRCKILSSGEPQCFEARDHTSGHTYQLHIGPLQEQEHSDTLLVVAHDISESKRIEKALRESEGRFRALFEGSPDAIFVTDSQGLILDCNPAACEMTGQSAANLRSRQITHFLGESADARLKHLPSGEAGWYESTCHAGNGTVHPVEIWARYIEYRNQQALLYYVRDIGQPKKMEAELQQAHGKLSYFQRLEIAGRMASAIAHEVNNYLVSILGLAEIGLQEAAEGSPLSAYFVEIGYAAQLARSASMKLLHFDQQRSSELRAVNLNKIIQETLPLLRHRFGNSYQIDVELERDLPLIRGDELHLNQIVMNLCLNARDAMPNGGRLQLRTHTHLANRAASATPDAFVELIISDTGCGMDEQTRSHIFEPFFTTKANGRGTGLGLWLVKRIVELHNGTIDLQSEIGRGTQFRIRLPVHQSQKSTQSAKPRAQLPRGQGQRILVAEDEELVRQYITRVLRELNYEPIITHNGFDALEYLKSNPADLMIADVVMPYGGGYEIYEKITTEHSALPILLISGYDLGDEIARIYKSSENRLRFLKKPFTIEALASQIHALLQKEG